MTLRFVLGFVALRFTVVVVLDFGRVVVVALVTPTEFGRVVGAASRVVAAAAARVADGEPAGAGTVVVAPPDSTGVTVAPAPTTAIGGAVVGAEPALVVAVDGFTDVVVVVVVEPLDGMVDPPGMVTFGGGVIFVRSIDGGGGSDGWGTDGAVNEGGSIGMVCASPRPTPVDRQTVAVTNATAHKTIDRRSPAPSVGVSIRQPYRPSAPVYTGGKPILDRAGSDGRRRATAHVFHAFPHS